MYVLDTSIISELRKPRPHGAVLSWYRSHPLRDFYLPSVALYELQTGVELIRTQNQRKADEIDAWIDEVASAFQILPLDALSARLAARWMHAKSQELTEDAMIAAIAVTNRFTVATRNVRDFQKFPVALLNPFPD